MAFKDRPLFYKPVMQKKSHQFIMQQHDTNLGEVLAVKPNGWEIMTLILLT